MAQVAFSHQFSHRWSNAPQAVKDALLQEFEDIMLLLDADTDLESFEFTVPDLHSHIDAINAEVAAEKEAARLEAERLEAERLEAERAEFEALEAERLLNEEQQTLEQQQAEEQQADSELVDSSIETDVEEASTTESSEIETLESQEEATEVEAADTDTETLESQPTAVTSTETAETDISAPASFAFDNTAPQAELDEDFIKELENRIDDYLSEQLANMSEDLKSWLREQMVNRLNNK